MQQRKLERALQNAVLHHLAFPSQYNLVLNQFLQQSRKLAVPSCNNPKCRDVQLGIKRNDFYSIEVFFP